MEFIKMQTIKDNLFMLSKQDDKYFCTYAKINTDHIDITSEEETLDINDGRGNRIIKFSFNIASSITVPLLPKDKIMYSITNIRDEEEFDTFMNMLKVIL